MVDHSQPKSSSFACSICLGAIRVLSTTADSKADDKPIALNQSDNPVSIFEVSSCKHKFCAACLRAYVRSKLMDGLLDIPCCHSMIHPWEEEFRDCGKPLSEDDLCKLIRMKICDEPKKDGWLCKADEVSSGTCDSDEGNEEMKLEDNELWIKYQKLKFDKHHGKEVVRRCPNCDEAHLFDEERMKEFQTKFLPRIDEHATNNGQNASSRDNNDSSGAVNRFGQMISSFRQSRAANDVPANVPNVVARNDNDNAASPPPKHEDKETDTHKEKENNSPLEGIAPTLSVDSKPVGQVDSFLSPPVDSEGDCSRVGEGTNEPEVNQSKTSSLEEKDRPIEDDVKSSEEDSASTKLAGDETGSCLPDQDDSNVSLESKSSDKIESEDNAPNLVKETTMIGICQPCSPESKVTQNDPTILVKAIHPVVTCRVCSSEFCYFHSNAHSGKSDCVEYHKEAMERDRANIEYASRTLRAKPCPTCGIEVSKEGGCNQMKCGSCGTHFCWLCGVVVDDGAFPEHFRWWNLRGCANMQLDEADRPLTCTIWGARLLSVLQIIVLGIPSVVLALVSMLLCPCFVPGCGRTNRERVVNMVSFWGSLISSCLLLPFTCLGMILLSALYLFLAVIHLLMKGMKGFSRSRTRQGGGSEEPRNTSVQGDANPTGPANAAQDDFLRELENIFERLEEGRLQALND